MKRKNQTILGVISAVIDAALIFVSYLIAVSLRFDVLDGFVSIPMNSQTFYLLILGYAIVAVAIYSGFHLYQFIRIRRFWRDAGIILSVNVICVLALTAVLFAMKIMDFSRATLVLFLVISSLLVIGKRFLVGRAKRNLQKQDRFQRHVIVVGNGRNAQNYMNEVRQQPELGLKVEGYVSGAPKAELGESLGSYEDLGDILEKTRCDELVVALEPHEINFMPMVLKAADKEGTRVEMIPMYSEYYPTHPTIESIGETKLVDLRATPLDNIALAALKRTGDILLSAILLVLLSPIMLIIAIGVKVSSTGPILFKQERIGKGKKPFIMLKFRSMRTDIDHTGWSKDEDPRKTKFGSFIRKCSLDELPQLINVLMGQMSLVGPRPELPKYVKQFKEEIPLYLIRQQVRPGMTGWAQVHGLRGDTPIDKRVEYDIWYIQNWSIGLDIKILFKTVFGGMINKEKLS